MGNKGPMGFLSLDEFKSRTSTWGRRLGAISKVDAAYDAFMQSNLRGNSSQVEAAAANLHQALYVYLVEKGGFWDKVDRDKESGGLLKWLYEQTRVAATKQGPMTREQDLDQRARSALERLDIPHSRFGVLYLFGNIDIDMNMWTIGLEGVAAVGGAVGQGLSTNFDQLHSASLVEKTVDIKHLGNVKTSTITQVAGTPFSFAGKAVNGTGTSMPTDRFFNTRPIPSTGTAPNFEVYRRPAPALHALPGFPLTRALFDALPDEPVILAHPAVLLGSAALTAGAVVVDALNNLRVMLINQVTKLFEWIKNKMLTDGTWAWDISAKVVSKMIKFIVGKCLESAAPFIGGGMDLLGGIAKTFNAAKERLGVYFLKQNIVINPGHPELAAQSIERSMSLGMFDGLWSVLKGVASLSLSAMLPGAGSLVSAIVTGIEWMVKLLWRLWEQSKIKKFLAMAREHFSNEKALATTAEQLRLSHPGRYLDETTGSPTQLFPEMDKSKGGIIHDLDKFKAFYSMGCSASPLIPMLTLNSGICGSLMVLIRMFDDAQARIDQSAWNAGTDYFARLKTYGRNYLAQSGFAFKALDPDNKSVQGYLNHAVSHHTANAGKMDKALAFAAGLA